MTQVVENSDVLNERIADHVNGQAPGDAELIPFAGWYWRDVDWAADSVALAVFPDRAPSWYASTVEAMMGKRWTRSNPCVVFCQANKWGYHMITVDGDRWDRLRALVVATVADPDNRPELIEYLNSLAPEKVDVP